MILHFFISISRIRFSGPYDLIYLLIKWLCPAYWKEGVLTIPIWAVEGQTTRFDKRGLRMRKFWEWGFKDGLTFRIRSKNGRIRRFDLFQANLSGIKRFDLPAIFFGGFKPGLTFETVNRPELGPLPGCEIHLFQVVKFTYSDHNHPNCFMHRTWNSMLVR